MRRFVFLWAAVSLLPATPAAGAEDLQAVIDAAEPGSIVTVSAGTYKGPVVIDKSLELLQFEGG